MSDAGRGIPLENKNQARFFRLQQQAKNENKESKGKTFSLEDAGLSTDEQTDGPTSLKEVADNVEGMVLGLMVKQMQKTVKRSGGPFSGGYGAKVFRERLFSKYAQNMAEARDFGIAEKVYEQFSSQVSPAGNSSGLSSSTE